MGSVRSVFGAGEHAVAAVRAERARRGEHADRLAGDSGRARLQSRSAWADEGGSEGASGGRKDAGDRRRAEEGGRAQGRYLAPRGARARQFHAPLPAAGQHQCGGDQSAGAGWCADCDHPQTAEAEAASSPYRHRLSRLCH